MKKLKQNVKKIAGEKRLAYGEAPEFRNCLETVCNSLAFNAREAEEELYGHETDAEARAFLEELAKAWVFYWTGGKNLRIDGRNKRSVQICRDIADSEAFSNISPDKDFRCTVIMQEIGCRMHRTLVQSVSALMFLILAEAYPEVGREMRERNGERWYRSPMI